MNFINTALKAALIGSGLLLYGCLVSEEPVLDANNGRATPIAAGSYSVCSIEDGVRKDDCELFAVSYDGAGLYRLVKDDEDPTEMRFRKVGRKGYAVQSREDDSTFQYYYGSGDSDRFSLTMMLCADLPDKTRASLIARNDLSSDDKDFETCAVNTLRGLTRAAKAYHRGRVVSDEEIILEFLPAPEGAVPAAPVSE